MDVAQIALVVGIPASVVTTVAGVVIFRRWLWQQIKKVRDMWRREREQRQVEITNLQEQVTKLQNQMQSRMANDLQFTKILATLQDRVGVFEFRAGSLQDTLDKLSSNASLTDARAESLEKFGQETRVQLAELRKNTIDMAEVLNTLSTTVKETVDLTNEHQKDIAGAVQANIALQGRVIDLEKNVSDLSNGIHPRVGGTHPAE